MAYEVNNFKKFVGKTVSNVRRTTKEENDDFAWCGNESGIVIEFTDGTYLLALRDAEGNGPGALLHADGIFC